MFDSVKDPSKSMNTNHSRSNVIRKWILRANKHKSSSEWLQLLIHHFTGIYDLSHNPHAMNKILNGIKKCSEVFETSKIQKANEAIEACEANDIYLRCLIWPSVYLDQYPEDVEQINTNITNS